MNHRKTHAIQVDNQGDEDIRIQWDGSGSDESFVFITAAQAELVCKWIMEVAADIESARKQKGE